MIGDIRVILAPRHARCHPMAGIVGAGEPPFGEMIDRGFNEGRAVPARAAAGEINLADDVISGAVHHQFKHKVSSHPSPAGIPSVTAPAPERDRCQTSGRTHDRAAGGAGNHHREAGENSAKSETTVEPP